MRKRFSTNRFLIRSKLYKPDFSFASSNEIVFSREQSEARASGKGVSMSALARRAGF